MKNRRKKKKITKIKNKDNKRSKNQNRLLLLKHLWEKRQKKRAQSGKMETRFAGVLTLNILALSFFLSLCFFPCGEKWAYESQRQTVNSLPFLFTPPVSFPNGIIFLFLTFRICIRWRFLALHRLWFLRCLLRLRCPSRSGRADSSSGACGSPVRKKGWRM